ncbi:MAG: hypothetical protein LBF75_05880 [Treponema sp.]|jgi:hypothetical protein|nr:hypothetical protein [Treponema sp.]
MKKTVLSAVLIGLLSGVSAFAQNGGGLSFDGVIASGIGWYFDDDGSKMFAVDNYMETAGGWFRLNAALDNAEKTSGIKFRMEAQPASTNGLYPFVRYFYGYTNLFGDMVTLKGGMVDDATFATAGDSIGTDGDEGLGGLLIIKPFSMLKLGFGAYIGPRSSDKILNIKSASNGELDALDGAYTASFAFSLPDVFDYTLGYRFKFKNKDESDPDNQEKTDRLVTGVNIRALKNVTLAFDTLINGISDKSITGMYALTTAYSDDPLTVGLDTMIQSSDGKDAPALGFMLYGSYAVKKLVPRMDVYFGIGGTGGKMYYWEYYYEGVTYNTKDKFVGFRPSLKYNATESISVECGDLINIRMPDSTDTTFDNSLYLSFVYKF